jgi:hypothetical protein
MRRPLNLNSHNQHAGRPCFSLAVLIGRPRSTLRYDISRFRTFASHVSVHAIHAHVDCSPLHRSMTTEPSCARCKQSARQATRMTIGPHCMRRQPHDLLGLACRFHFRSSFNCGGTTDGAELRTCAKGGSRHSRSIAAPDVSDELSTTTASARLVNKFDHFEAHNRPSTIARLAELLCRASGRRSGAWKHIHDYHGQSASISWVSRAW